MVDRRSAKIDEVWRWRSARQVRLDLDISNLENLSISVLGGAPEYRLADKCGSQPPKRQLLPRPWRQSL